MAKEYRTFVYQDNAQGRAEMGADIARLGNEGWTISSKEVTQQGWDFGKTCCLGVIFFPLALLGKKENVIQVIFEREKTETKEGKKPTGKE